MKRVKKIVTPEQARLDADAHINSVAASAERRSPGFAERALAKLAKWAEKQSATFTVEAARAHIADKLPEPVDLRAWGAVTTMAIRRRILKPTDSFAPAASSHGSPKRLYMFGGGR